MEGLVRVPEQTHSAPDKHILHTFVRVKQMMLALHVHSCSKFVETIFPRALYTRFAVGFYVTLLANSMLPCTWITSSSNWT